MSWRQKTMTGVEDCEKFGVVVKQTLLLYEQAVIAEGSSVSDPVAFAKRVNDLIARDAR
jgi:HSP90 family molecular chaperone